MGQRYEVRKLIEIINNYLTNEQFPEKPKYEQGKSELENIKNITGEELIETLPQLQSIKEYEELRKERNELLEFKKEIEELAKKYGNTKYKKINKKNKGIIKDLEDIIEFYEY